MLKASNPPVVDRIDRPAQCVEGRSAQALRIPSGHIGPIALPGSGRLVWWTGRVAIGLRHQDRREVNALSQSGQWIQSLLLERRPRGPATA